MMRNTLITWVISHYLFGELCQRCQCITTTNQGITYHCFARLYLSSCTVELCCSALISSDDKESYSSPQSPVFSVRSYYYNEVNHWLQSSRWIWWLFSCAASVLPCSCSSPCSPRSPAELTRDRKKKIPQCLAPWLHWECRTESQGQERSRLELPYFLSYGYFMR